MLRPRAALFAFALAPLGALAVAACLGEDVTTEGRVDPTVDGGQASTDGSFPDSPADGADAAGDAASGPTPPPCGGKAFTVRDQIAMPANIGFEFFGARLASSSWPTAPVDVYFGAQIQGTGNEQHIVRGTFDPALLAITFGEQLTPTDAGEASQNWSPAPAADGTVLFARGLLGARRLVRRFPDGGVSPVGVAGTGLEVSEPSFVPDHPTRLAFGHRAQSNQPWEIRFGDVVNGGAGVANPTTMPKLTEALARDYAAPVVDANESIVLFARATTTVPNSFTAWQVRERVRGEDLEHPELDVGPPMAPSWLSGDGCHLLYIGGNPRRMYHAQRSPN